LLARLSGKKTAKESRGAIRNMKTPTLFKELGDRLRQSLTTDVRGELFEIEPRDQRVFRDAPPSRDSRRRCPMQHSVNNATG